MNDYGTKFKIGQTVYKPVVKKKEILEECNDCGGTGRIRIIYHDDSVVSIECEKCNSLDGKPTGQIKRYLKIPSAVECLISGFSVNGENNIEYKTDYDSYKESNLFLTYDEACEKAKQSRDEDNKNTFILPNKKELPHKTWAMNALFYKKQVAYYEKEAERYKKKLNAANLKIAKSEKTKKEIQ